MSGLPVLERMLAEMFGGVVRQDVQADPYKHRKVTYTDADKGSRRYFECRNGKGQRVRFYRSVHRNIAGYFLIWRETTFKNGSYKNDMVRAFKSKSSAMRTNRERYNKAKGN
jgi:hypothetical protein